MEIEKRNNPCKCCGGSGVKITKSGIRINCPACRGKGHTEERRRDLTYWELREQLKREVRNFEGEQIN